jgi:hypothetical protein
MSKEFSGKEVVKFIYNNYDYKKLVKFLTRDISRNIEAYISKPLSLYILKSRTIINHYFSLKKPRFSFSINYVTVNKNRIYKNSTSYSVIKEAYNTL